MVIVPHIHVCGFGRIDPPGVTREKPHLPLLTVPTFPDEQTVTIAEYAPFEISFPRLANRTMQYGGQKREK